MGNTGKAEIDPYSPVPGSVPPALVGRDADLRQIEKGIVQSAAGRAANALVFTGERGMGKTTMLRRAAQMVRENNGIVLHAEMSPDKTLTQLFERSMEHARDDLRGKPGKLLEQVGRAAKAVRYTMPAPEGVEIGSVGLDWRQENRGFVYALDDLNKAAHKHGRFIAITIDEIQSGDPAQLRDLAAYVMETHEPKNPVLFIAAGLPETQAFIKEQVKTYTERWKYRVVGLLSRDDAREAIERPARDLGVRLEPEALERLVDASGGYPHLVQQVASEAWEQRSGKVITLKDVERAIPIAREHMANVYAGRLNELSSRECAFVVALADLGPGYHAIGDVASRMGVKSSAHISSVRERLETKDVIRSPHTGVIEFRLPLMDGYVREHRDEFLQRASVRFSPMMQQIGQRVALQHDAGGGKAIALGDGRRTAGRDRGVGRGD